MHVFFAEGFLFINLHVVSHVCRLFFSSPGTGMISGTGLLYYAFTALELPLKISVNRSLN
jgi:hypothetical protein